MKRIKLKWQIVIITTLILLSLAVFISYRVSNNIEEYHINSLIQRMDQNTKLIGQYILENDNYIEDITNETVKHSEITNSRITIIDREGIVLADSSYDNVSEMDNHIDREEVSKALENSFGHSLRYSDTLNSNMLYYAYLLEQDNKEDLIIRSAIPLTRIESYLQSQFYQIIIGTIVAVIILILFSSIMITRLLNPIERVQNAFQTLNKGNYDIYLNQDKQTSYEANNLIKAFNNMSLQLKRNIEEIRKREIELNTLIKSMDSGLLFIDKDEKVKLINPKARQFLDYHADENVHYIKISRKPAISNNIEMCFNERTSLRKEIEFFDNNIKKYFQLLINPLFEGVNFLGLIVLLYDITDIKNSEKARSDLIANVSHELRTPITSISGFIETLKSMDPKDPEFSDFIDIIEKESEKLKMLVLDLLDLAKLESKKLKLKRSSIDIIPIIDSVLTLLKERIESKNLIIEKELNDSSFIFSDPLRTEQIIYNIIDNAVKYTNENGKINIKTYKEDNYLAISISDTGIGIEKAKISRVTEQFYREEKSRSKLIVEGYGLGLAIVKNLVDLLKGKLEIYSKQNEGTTVIVKLPKDKS